MRSAAWRGLASEGRDLLGNWPLVHLVITTNTIAFLRLHLSFLCLSVKSFGYFNCPGAILGPTNLTCTWVCVFCPILCCASGQGFLCKNERSDSTLFRRKKGALVDQKSHCLDILHVTHKVPGLQISRCVGYSRVTVRSLDSCVHNHAHGYFKVFEPPSRRSDMGNCTYARIVN